MRIISVLCLFLVVGQLHAESLSAWVKRQSEKDSVLLARKAMSNPVVGTTNVISTNTVYSKTQTVLMMEPIYCATMEKYGFGYTTSRYDVVAMQLYQMMQTNSAMITDVFTLKSSFEPIASWWNNDCRQISFTNYPWGVSNVTRVVTSAVPVYGASVAQSNGWGVVTAASVEDALRK